MDEFKSKEEYVKHYMYHDLHPLHLVWLTVMTCMSVAFSGHLLNILESSLPEIILVDTIDRSDYETTAHLYLQNVINENAMSYINGIIWVIALGYAAMCLGIVLFILQLNLMFNKSERVKHEAMLRVSYDIQKGELKDLGVL